MESTLQDAGRKKALEIIRNSKFMVLASSSLSSRPWIATLRYACDKDLNFYFISSEKRLHVQNILENPNVALTLLSVDEDIGVQIEGSASKVDIGDLGEATRIYYDWRFPDPFERARHYMPPKHFDTDSDQRFFKIQVLNAYIKFKDEISKERIAIKLK